MDDLISREKVLLYIDRILTSGTGKNKSFEFMRKYVEQMPSAQPVDKDTNVPSKDTIDRQLAIDAFKPYAEYESNRSNKDWVKRIEVILSDLPSTHPEPNWIPVSKELPPIPTGRKEYFLNGSDVAADEYIVMIDGAKLPTSLLWSGDTWFDVDGIGYKVLAWCRLPEPYKGE